MFYVIGNSASIAGVAVSLLGLGFAILQIRKLRGETRAAREAAQETRQAIGRELTTVELTRLESALQELKGIHRDGDRLRALGQYSQIQTMLGQIQTMLGDLQRRHPSPTARRSEVIADASQEIARMESRAEELSGALPKETKTAFNNTLSRIQRELIPLLEDLPGGPG